MDEQIEFKSNLEVPKKLKRRHLAPYISATSELLGGADGSWRGSKFWVLGDDSYEDCRDICSIQKGESKEDSYNSDKDLMRDAIRSGFLVDDVLRAEALLKENFHSPKFASVERGTGHIRHPRPMASRITEAVADLRLKKNRKPWWGPLPKSRSLQNRQLGDLPVKDLRSSGPDGTVKSLRDLCDRGGGLIDFDLEERGREGTRSDFVLKRSLSRTLFRGGGSQGKRERARDGSKEDGGQFRCAWKG